MKLTQIKTWFLQGSGVFLTQRAIYNVSEKICLSYHTITTRTTHNLLSEGYLAYIIKIYYRITANTDDL